MKIILASKSPRRKELLEEMGYEFDIVTKDTLEIVDSNLTIRENVCNIAYDKGEAVFKDNKDSIVISSDTVVVFDNKIYGKPKCKEEAFSMLKTLSNNYHEVISGLCVFVKDKVYKLTETSRVYFKDLSDEDILEYLSHDEYKDKAGSYAIQGLGNKLVLKYEGSYNNIVGLPTEKLKEILNEIGI